MSVFDRFKKKEERGKDASVLASPGVFPGTGKFFGGAERERSLLLSAVYRCVDLISASVGLLPLITYKFDEEKGQQERFTKHISHRLLQGQPNEDMTPYVFFRALVASILLQGNGYAYIDRDKDGKVRELIFLPAQIVAPTNFADKNGVWHVRYLVGSYRGRTFGDNGVVLPSDILHLKNFSHDGLVGISTLAHARVTLGLSTASEEYASNTFANGSITSGVLRMETGGTTLTPEQKEKVYQAWEQRSRSSAGAFMILDYNMHYDPININPKDSQLLESRKFNVIDICRFFSVSPVKAFDLSQSSYNTIEATQLSFLSETIQPYLTQIEQEFSRKLFFDFEKDLGMAVRYDAADLLRTDGASQAAYMSKLFAIGAITPNEARAMANLPPIAGGDRAFVQVNMMPLDKVDALGSKKMGSFEAKEETEV
jgi:HK97 family phage portal protein